VKRTSGRFRRDLQSLDEVFRYLREFSVAEKLDEGVEFCINLVVEELFTNMVKYNSGDQDEISISIRREGDRILLDLVDLDVDPFDPSTVGEVDVTLPIEERRAGGLGLHLVKSIVDEITYRYEDREMTVSVIKVLEH
jgi:serine/threonine-protein kinase RsbW